MEGSYSAVMSWVNVPWKTDISTARYESNARKIQSTDEIVSSPVNSRRRENNKRSQITTALSTVRKRKHTTASKVSSAKTPNLKRFRKPQKMMFGVTFGEF